MKEDQSKKISLPVEGMTCASCVVRVEKAINRIEGVSNVSVNLATEKVTFDLEPGKTDINKIADVVEEAGYKVVLKEPSSDSKDSKVILADQYAISLKKDFKFSLLLTIPVFLISMLMELNYFHQYIHSFMDTINKILLILTTPIIFVSGQRFFKSFWNNLKHFSADMNSLVAIGTGSAFIYSALVVLFPDFILSAGKKPHVYFDSAAVIITLILMGRLLENQAKQKTSLAIKKLIQLKPESALVRRNDIERLIKINDLYLDDIVIIKPGERISADGIITRGSSSVDESAVTGESLPISKKTGDKVVGGTINKNGTFEFRITALGDNSVLGKIIRYVEEAQGSKAPIQKIVDKIASVFVPVVVLIALLTLVFWLFNAEQNSFEIALLNFIAVLVIACPCALGLATPTAIMVGTGIGANLGILIKNGESLEIAHKISTIVLDKTGTITYGKPTVTDIISLNINDDELLMLTASVENRSEHSIATAIVEKAKEAKVSLGNPEVFDSLTGLGITGIINGKEVAIGNDKLMKRLDINIEELSDKFESFVNQGKTVVYISVDRQLKGLMAVTDPIKDNSPYAISQLKKMGLKTVMLTGDNYKTANAIAKQSGVDTYLAEILPEEKAREIEKLQHDNEIVAMVGDGINDAPALVKSDIGIAMGNGTDIAIESSDITILKNNLLGVANAIKLSGKIIKTIKQNLFWAFIYNIIGIPLAAAGLLNPMFAALAMSLSSVSVVTNSLRLRNFKISAN